MAAEIGRLKNARGHCAARRGCRLPGVPSELSSRRRLATQTAACACAGRARPRRWRGRPVAQGRSPTSGAPRGCWHEKAAGRRLEAEGLARFRAQFSQLQRDILGDGADALQPRQHPDRLGLVLGALDGHHGHGGPDRLRDGHRDRVVLGQRRARYWRAMSPDAVPG
jgi:hypothetical protein